MIRPDVGALSELFCFSGKLDRTASRNKWGLMASERTADICSAARTSRKPVAVYTMSLEDRCFSGRPHRIMCPCCRCFCCCRPHSAVERVTDLLKVPR